MNRIPLPFSDDRIEICGNTDVYIDRCRRLLECSEMLVQLKICGHSVAVWGKGLTATDFSEAGLHISGEIAAIEFDGGI